MSVFAFVICLLALGANAVFEDQAGTFDWYKQHIGTVDRAFYHKTKPRTFVTTEQNVVAALHLRDGAIIWRRALGDEDRLDDVTYVHSLGVVVSLSGQGKYLRAWDQMDGALVWDAAMYSGASPELATSTMLVLDTKDATVAVAPGGALQLYDLSDGRPIWPDSVPLARGKNIHLVHDVSKSRLLAFTYDTGASTMKLVVVAEGSGAIQEQRDLAAGTPLGAQAAISGATLAVLSADGTSLCTATAEGITCMPLSSLAPQLPTSPSLQLLPTSSGFTLASTYIAAPGVALLAASPEGALQLLHHYPTSFLAAATVRLQQGDATALLQLTRSGGLEVQVVSSASGEVLHSELVPSLPALEAPKGAPALPAAAFLGTYRSKGGKEGLRLLLRWSDAALVLLQQGQAVWVRGEEALASVREVMFAELPADAATAAAAQPSLSDQLQLQILGFKAQLSLNTPEEAEELARLRQRLSSRSRPTRDANGLRKLLLLLTGAGKLVALHTGGGEPLWSRRWGPSAAPERLLQWRTFHDVSHAPQVLLLRTGPNPSADVVDAHSGAEVARLKLPGAIQKIVQVSPNLHDGTAEQHVYLAIPPSGPPTLLPDTPAARAHLAALAPSLSYWLLDSSTPTPSLVGYGLQAASPLEEGGPVVEAQERWRIQLPEPVLGLAAREPSEPVHSLSKILGNRSFLIKYLNPNTLFLATGPPAGQAPPSALTSADPPFRLTAYIIDTASGRILHRQTHPGGRGPVHATFSENWVAYHYFSTATSRLQMSVMELYDATPRSFSALDLVAGRVGAITQSSSAPPPLRVLTQSYFSHTPLRALTTTRTARGISSKQLLLATATDQVYAMDKRFLDPRRPLTARPSKEDQEEGLIPYMDTLPIFPALYITYDRQVAGLRGVAASPAALESSSHVLAWGVDVMYTRVQPSGGFDTLPDDFSYALLVAAITALAGGAVALAFAGKRAELQSKWR